MKLRFNLMAALLAVSLASTVRAADDSAAILTPKPTDTPRLTGARVYGERAGKPFFFTVTATGDEPITYAADGLPQGLSLDAKSGAITGRCEDKGSHSVKLTATNAKGADNATLDIVIGDTVCLTPPLGWNSWNHFNRSIDDVKVRAAADSMVASGLAKHGWTYINIDDCWEGQRDAQGRIQGNEKFPDMKALADYVHSKGLKIGIYSSPGPKTCAGFNATWKHEDQDAQTYADWGFDYVKYDWCSYGGIAREKTAERYAEAIGGSGDELKKLYAERAPLASNKKRTADQNAQLKEIDKQLNEILKKLDPDKKKEIDLEILKEPYRAFRGSLDKVDRDIVFSYCQYGMGNSWEWAGQLGGNCWRTTGDINASWKSLSNIGFHQLGHEKFAGPGHWNDPDMLEIGNGHLTPDEQYTHMSLWCLLSAPLLIGCDMTKMDDFVTSVFLNDEVLAVDQDPLGKQAALVGPEGMTEVYAKELADGSHAVGLFNLSEEPAKIVVDATNLGITGKQTVRDLWRQKDLEQTDGKYEATVAPHGVVLVRLIPVK